MASDETNKQADEDNKRADEEKERADEDNKQADEEKERADEEKETESKPEKTSRERSTSPVGAASRESSPDDRGYGSNGQAKDASLIDFLPSM